MKYLMRPLFTLTGLLILLAMLNIYFLNVIFVIAILFPGLFGIMISFVGLCIKALLKRSIRRRIQINLYLHRLPIITMPG